MSDRLDALRRLFPELVADGRWDLDPLRALLAEAGEAVATEPYGLSWPGKREDRRRAGRPATHTLRPMPGEGVDEHATRNHLVVGENLEVLRALRASYAGAVRLAYLDPPYNTGADLLYRDRFAEPAADHLRDTGQADARGRLVSNTQAGGRHHSAWLGFMYPRLQAVRALLAPDGLLVVHIDEHELESLVMLGKEVFGEDAYLGTIVWDKGNPKGDARRVATQHESIVVFARDPAAIGPLRRPKAHAARLLDAAREAMEGRSLEKARAEFARRVREMEGLSGGEAAYERLDERGRVYRLVSMAWPGKKPAPEAYFRPLHHSVTGRACPVPARGWRYPPETMDRLLAEGLVEFGADHRVQPQRRTYLDETRLEPIPSVVRHAGADDALLRAWGLPFDHPKPVALAARLVSWFSGPDDLVLDCFAGSGTTGHATWLANREDGGRRRFLLVQVDAPPESGRGGPFRTLDEITRARLRKAARALRDEGATGDLGFRVLRAAPLDEPHADRVPELLLRLGLPLDAPREHVGAGLWRFVGPGRPLLACLDAALDPALPDLLRAHPGHTFACRDDALGDVDKVRLADVLASVGSTLVVL